MNAKKIDQFFDLARNSINKNFCICSHDNPDPDSLASCLGVGMSLNLLGVDEVEMIHHGEISDLQNRSMHTVLGIPIKSWDLELQVKYDKLGENAIYIFVDCTPDSENMSVRYKPAVVIDHHKKTIVPKDCIFIHEETGSCSTIISEMIHHLTFEEDETSKKATFSEQEDETKTVATALALGIKLDTNDFLHEGTTDNDFRAYRLLTQAPSFSGDKFRKILDYQLPVYYIDYRARAWGSKIFNSPNLLLGLGIMQKSHGDCLARIADEHLRIDGVQTVVAYGIVGNYVRGSVRTTSTSISPESLIHDIFGKENGGTKTGGIGGARFQLNNLFCDLPLEDKNNLWDITRRIVERKFEDATQK